MESVEHKAGRAGNNRKRPPRILTVNDIIRPSGLKVLHQSKGDNTTGTGLLPRVRKSEVFCFCGVNLLFGYTTAMTFIYTARNSQAGEPWRERARGPIKSCNVANSRCLVRLRKKTRRVPVRNCPQATLGCNFNPIKMHYC